MILHEIPRISLHCGSFAGCDDLWPGTSLTPRIRRQGLSSQFLRKKAEAQLAIHFVVIGIGEETLSHY